MSEVGERLSWRMPPPPPDYVLSVRDSDGREWTRTDLGLWSDGWNNKSWDWLLYHGGEITADELAH